MRKLCTRDEQRRTQREMRIVECKCIIRECVRVHFGFCTRWLLGKLGLELGSSIYLSSYSVSGMLRCGKVGFGITKSEVYYNIYCIFYGIVRKKSL